MKVDKFPDHVFDDFDPLSISPEHAEHPRMPRVQVHGIPRFLASDHDHVIIMTASKFILPLSSNIEWWIQG